LVRDFVGGDVSKNVAVLREGINLSLEVNEEILVPSGVVGINGLSGKRSGNVEHDVDSSSLQLLHGVVVILGGIRFVNSNTVDSQGNKVWEISINGWLISKNIVIVGVGLHGLVADSLGPPLFPGDRIKEKIPLDNDWVQARNDRRYK